MNQEIKTMEETYGDTSDHLCCPNCGHCITCGDCNCKLRKEWEKQGLCSSRIQDTKQ